MSVCYCVIVLNSVNYIKFVVFFASTMYYELYLWDNLRDAIRQYMVTQFSVIFWILIYSYTWNELEYFQLQCCKWHCYSPIPRWHCKINMEIFILISTFTFYFDLTFYASLLATRCQRYLQQRIITIIQWY